MARLTATKEDEQKKEEIIEGSRLGIVWGDNSDYWRKHENGIAELIGVCWLEITGEAEVKKGTAYQVGFKVSMKRNAVGWTNNAPVVLMAWAGKERVWRGIYLAEKKGHDEFEIPYKSKLVIKVPSDCDDTKLRFGLYETFRSGSWKGGLKLHHAFVRELK